MLQPDISTAVTIIAAASILYFLAGANLRYLAIIGVAMAGAGYVVIQQLGYAAGRVSSFTAGLTDLTQTNYHAQQAIIAFMNGGWTGMGLGQGRQKFGFLPAPHTDSIFAVIGEELGVLGAAFVVLLFIIFVFRGFTISRRSRDSFGALLAAGITIWIITKALMNIAVMLNLLPSTGVALPFISFGGSSLVAVLAGAGLLVSVSRFTARREQSERTSRATLDRGRGDRGPRLPGARGG
jgi:cell division protein FtsW